MRSSSSFFKTTRCSASVIATPSGSCAITACSCASESCACRWRPTTSSASETRRASSEMSSKSSSPCRPGSAEVIASTPSRLPPASSGTTTSERDSIWTSSSSPGRATFRSGRFSAGRWIGFPLRKTSTTGMRRWLLTS